LKKGGAFFLGCAAAERFFAPSALSQTLVCERPHLLPPIEEQMQQKPIAKSHFRIPPPSSESQAALLGEVKLNKTV